MGQLQTSLLVIIVAIAAAVMFYIKRKNQEVDDIHYNTLDTEFLLNLTKRRAVEITRKDDIIPTSMTAAEYKVITANKDRLARARTDVVACQSQARDICIALTRDIIKIALLNSDDCNNIIDFKHAQYIPPFEKFVILMYYLARDYGDEALLHIAGKYKLTELRNVEVDLEGTLKAKYEFDDALLDEVFETEIITNPSYNSFPYEDQLDIIAIIVTGMWVGLNRLDVLRYLKVDGFNYGTSGSIMYAMEGNWNTKYRVTNSVWVQVDSIWVHFSFIDLGSVEEMERITKQITSFGNSQPLTFINPATAVSGPDGSRITAFMPPVGECYAAFIRKFNVAAYTLKFLWDKPYAKNSDLLIQVVYLIIKANQNLPFTGQQNTGKTTSMKGALEICDNTNIRILELAFELAAREIYKWMNIFTAKPTEYTSQSTIQSYFKKTDGGMSLIGEIAEPEVVPGALQFCKVASQRTMFSQHGKDDDGLVYGLSDDLVTMIPSMTRDTAANSVLDVIKFNLHHDIVDNNRVIAYLSELEKVSELKEYPPLKKSNTVIEAIDQIASQNREYYTRQTDRIRYLSRKIIVYNPVTQAYEPNDWFSDGMVKDICKNLDSVDLEAFLHLANNEFKEVRERRKQATARARRDALTSNLRGGDTA